MLANVTLDALRDEIIRVWKSPGNILRLIYEHSVPGAGIRRFLVEFYSKACNESTLKEGRTKWPEDVMWEVLEAVWALKTKGVQATEGKGKIAKWDMCQYHTHEEGVKCSGKAEIPSSQA